MEIKEVIRLVHPRHYSHRQKRFSSPAFSRSSDGTGASVIATNCAVSCSSAECNHIRRYYSSSIAGEPPIFLRLQIAEFPNDTKLTHDPSDGDDCHYLVEFTNKNLYRKILLQKELSQFEICDEGIPRELKLSDVLAQNPVAESP